MALARALATAPRLLLLDEPFTALDPVTVADIRRVLAAHLRASGTTTLFVTHDVVDAVTLADRLVVIEDGRVSQPERAAVGERDAQVTVHPAEAVDERRAGRWQAGEWTAGAVRLPAPGLSDGDAVALIPTGAVRVWSGRGAGERDSAEAAAFGASAPGIRWSARVVRIEATAAGVRLHTREPAVVCELAIAEFAAADVAAGDEVRLSIVATDVRVAAR
nr:hypothetical protein [Microbacterium hominis]